MSGSFRIGVLAVEHDNLFILNPTAKTNFVKRKIIFFQSLDTDQMVATFYVMAVKPTRKSKARTIIIDERNAPDVMRWVNSQYHLIAKQRGYPAAPKPTNILLDAVRQAIATKKGEQ